MSDFEKNIFINCPFDSDFKPLLRAILFTTIYCKLNPRIATERFNSADNRLSKIAELIAESKYGIHDLSRYKSVNQNEYYRLNMPFELGLDFGCIKFGNQEKYGKKHILVFESEKYTYQKAISDLSGSDIKCHNNKPKDLIFELRSWFSELGFKVDAGSIIWDEFNEFQGDFYLKKQAEGFKKREIEKIPDPEYIKAIMKWSESKNKK